MAIHAPEGTRDLLPDEALFWESFKRTAADVFGRCGYVPIDTPIIEQTELFVRGIGEATDVVGKEMFTAISGANLATLLDGGTIKSKSRLSLRPEGTAGVVRAVVQHDLVPQGAPPAKLMYAGPMFRAERPQRGRQRQFNQVGIECLGTDDPTVDAEAIIMLMRFYDAMGMPRDAMRVLLNSMGCERCRPAYRDAVRAYMEQHVGELCEDCHRRMETNPLRAFDCKNEGCVAVMADAPKITDHLCEECREHFSEVRVLLDAAGVAYELDPKLVRGLDYYTRTVFEVQVDNGKRSQSAIGGGGRYDKLAEEVGGRPTPGFGFALGYERTMLALQEAGVQFPDTRRCDVFVACVDDAARPQAFAVVEQLREAGVVSDMDHQHRSLKSQFKLADKLGACYVAVLGPDELAAGVANLRDMASHEERQVPLDALAQELSA